MGIRLHFLAFATARIVQAPMFLRHFTAEFDWVDA